VIARIAALVAFTASGVTAPGFAQDTTGDTIPLVVPDTAADSLPGPARYKNRVFGIPFVGYSPTTKVIFGVGGTVQWKSGLAAYDSTTRASNIGAGASVATAGQWGIGVSADLFSLGNRWWLSGKTQAGSAPSDYFGIGPLTDRSDTNRMKQKVVRFEAKVLRRVSSTIYLGPYYRLHASWAVDFRFPGRIASSLHGGDGTVSSGLGFSAQSDSRNSILTPTRGHYVVLDALANLRILGSEYDYPLVLIDARKYVALDRRRNHILALNLYGQFNGSEVPIQTMAQIGNLTTQYVMRGVYLGRFRDRHQLVAQADYRVRVWRRFGAVVFGAAGNVFGSKGASMGDAMKYTGGAGVRININQSDALNLRIDYTFTSFGEQGLSVGAGEAF